MHFLLVAGRSSAQGFKTLLAVRLELVAVVVVSSVDFMRILKDRRRPQILPFVRDSQKAVHTIE